jgi:3-oxoacyl-[acyl-carrier protein] reductase
MLLNKKVAVVTGGTRGIGRAIAERFAEEGAAVVVVGRGSGVAEMARELGDDAIGVSCDVANEQSVTALLAIVLDRFGRIDVLVNNAGMTRDGMIHRSSLEDFRAVVDVNLQGTWLCTRAVLGHMRDREGGGAIVNVASIAGKVGNLGQGAYSASKAGVVALTKTTAREGARCGVRANAIMPGLIDTDMTRSLTAEAWTGVLRTIPLGRAGLPSEVAEVALFLASDMSSYVTGTALEVAGGRNM